jgi:dienelactone hydrolase
MSAEGCAMLRGRALAALAALALVAGCAAETSAPVSVAPNPAAAQAAWWAAHVMLPGDADPQRLPEAAPRLARLEAGGKLPVVLFAHGCRGLDSEAAETMRLVASHGFAAIAPDHFARPDAGAACRAGPTRPIASPRQARRDGGYARVVPAEWSRPPEPLYVAQRLDEVSLALARLRSMRWVDQDEIYLVGHSLGRGTADLWPTRGLAAVAVLGQDCRGARASTLAELPLAVPVLPVADRRLGLGAEAVRGLHCGEFASRPVFSSMVVGVGAAGAASQPETQRALLDFLLGGLPPG